MALPKNDMNGKKKAESKSFRVSIDLKNNVTIY